MGAIFCSVFYFLIGGFFFYILPMKRANTVDERFYLFCGFLSGMLCSLGLFFLVMYIKQ